MLIISHGFIRKRSSSHSGWSHLAICSLISLLLLCGSIFAAEEDLVHQCVHEDIVDSVPLTKQNYAHVHTLNADASLGAKGVHRELSRTGTTNEWGNIRIRLDTSLLNVDTGFTCYRQYERVRIGNPLTPKHLCSADHNPKNCWWTCREEDTFNTRMVDQLLSVLDEPQEFFEKALMVKNSQNVRLVSKMCGAHDKAKVTVPLAAQENGYDNTDIVLFVTARPTFGGHLAYAVACEQNTDGRPVAGHINVGPSSLRAAHGREHQLARVVMHEMTHALGFSHSLFDQYTAQPVTLKSSDGSFLVVSPKAVEKARDHFGCTHVKGIPLEDFGSVGAAGSHWEMRALNGEYMNAVADLSVTPPVSGMTLGVLEDSGWYQVVWHMAEHLLWGHGEGCDFVQGDCGRWRKRSNEDPRYICSEGDRDKPVCTADRRNMGVCAFCEPERAHLPYFPAYLHNPSQAGCNPMMDFCPVAEPYQDTYCFDSASQEYEESEVFGGSRGPTSLCFESSVVSNSYSTSGIQWLGYESEVRPMCYPHRCHQGQMELFVGYSWHHCPSGTFLSNLPGFQGGIWCPSEEEGWCHRDSMHGLLAAAAEGSHHHHTGDDSVLEKVTKLRGGEGVSPSPEVSNLISIALVVPCCGLLMGLVFYLLSPLDRVGPGEPRIDQ